MVKEVGIKFLPKQRKKVFSSTDEAQSKPEAKSTAKDNIIKPQPRKLRNLWCLTGESTALFNVGSQHGNDLGKPCYTPASPPADYYQVESLLWESLLDDREMNLTMNSSFLGSASAANLEYNESLFAESNAPRWDENWRQRSSNKNKIVGVLIFVLMQTLGNLI
ncbi:hypothetical protein OIU76_027954 [Salix suchowensis]|nr:hypothetical protein OIU76_027954 [Salix suchowensis]